MASQRTRIMGMTRFARGGTALLAASLLCIVTPIVIVPVSPTHAEEYGANDVALSVSLETIEGRFAVNQEFQTTVSVVNDGPASTDVRLVLDPSPGLVLNFANADYCVPAGDIWQCDLVAGAPWSFSFGVFGTAIETETLGASVFPTSIFVNQVPTGQESTSLDLIIEPYQADLGLSLSSGATELGVGEPFVIEAVLTSNGPLTPADARVTFNLPGLVPVWSESTQGCYVAPPGLICDVLSLVPGQYEAVIGPIQFVGEYVGTFSVQGQVSSSLPDLNPGNDGDEITFSYGVAGLGATLEIGDLRDPVSTGDPLTDIVTVTNTGNVTLVAPVVEMVAFVGTSVEFVRGAISTRQPYRAPASNDSACSTGPSMTCVLPDLAPGEVVYVSAAVTAALGDVDVTAALYFDGISGADRFATESTSIVAPASDLSLVGPPDVVATGLGGSILVPLQVVNDGPSAALGVVVRGTVPNGYTAQRVEAYSVDPDPTIGSPEVIVSCDPFDDEQLRCDLGDRPPGENLDLYVTLLAPATPDSIGPANMAFVVGADSPADPDLADTDIVVGLRVVGPTSDLSIDGGHSPGTLVAPGSHVKRIVSVGAFGEAVPDARLEIQLPVGADLTSVVDFGTGTGVACVRVDQRVSCDLGTVDPTGPSRALVIDFVAADVTTTAEVRVASTIATDANSANDAVDVVLAVGTNVDFVALLFPQRRFVHLPERATWTAQLYTAQASGLVSSVDDAVFEIVLPEGLSDVQVDVALSPPGAPAPVCTVEVLVVRCVGVVNALTMYVEVSAVGPLGTYRATASGSHRLLTDINPVSANSNLSTTYTNDVVDLHVTVDAPPTASVGDPIVFVPTLQNIVGPADAVTPTISAIIPVGATFVSADPLFGECDFAPATRVLTCVGNVTIERPTFTWWSQMDRRITVIANRPGPLSITFVGSSATTTVNTADDSAIATVLIDGIAIDTTPPVVTGATTDPAPNAAGWHRGDADGEVRLVFAGTDDSGVEPTCTTAFITGPDNGNALVTGVCTDAAGNESDPFDVLIKFDRTAPVAGCPILPPADTWFASEVVVTCAVTDATSGVEADRTTVTLATDVGAGNASNSAVTPALEVHDVAGNMTTFGPFGPFQVDRADPTVVLTLPANGATYEVGNVPSPAFDCADVGSGVVTCTASAFDVGPGTHTFSVTVTDGVGRSTQTTATYNVARTISAGDDQSGFEGSGEGVLLTGSDDGFDDGPGDGVVWDYRAGDDVDAGATCEFIPADALETRFSCTDDGTFTVSVAYVDDSSPQPVADTATVVLANGAPIVGIVEPPIGNRSTPAVRPALVNASVAVTDPGSNDTIDSCTIDWGDSFSTVGVVTPTGPGAATCSGSHTYAANGDRTIVVTATDDDSGTGSDFVDITIELAPPGTLRIVAEVFGGTPSHANLCATALLADGTVMSRCDSNDRSRDGVITLTGVPAGGATVTIAATGTNAASYTQPEPIRTSVPSGTTVDLSVVVRRLVTVSVQAYDLFHKLGIAACFRLTPEFDDVGAVEVCSPDGAAVTAVVPFGDWGVSEQSTPFGFLPAADQSRSLSTSTSANKFRFDHQYAALLRVSAIAIGAPAPGSGLAGGLPETLCVTVTALDGSGSRQPCPNTTFAEIAVPVGSLRVTFPTVGSLVVPSPTTVVTTAGATSVVLGSYRKVNDVFVGVADADTGEALRGPGLVCFLFTPSFAGVEPATHCKNGSVDFRLVATMPAGSWTVTQTSTFDGYAVDPTPRIWDGTDRQTLMFSGRPIGLRVRLLTTGGVGFADNGQLCVRVLTLSGLDAVPQQCATSLAAPVVTFTGLAPGAYTVKFPFASGSRGATAANLATPADAVVTIAAGGSTLVDGIYRPSNRVRIGAADADTGVVIPPGGGGACFHLIPDFVGPAPVNTCIVRSDGLATLTLLAGPWTIVQTTAAPGYVLPTATATWNGSDNVKATVPNLPVGLRIRATVVGAGFESQPCATVTTTSAVAVASLCTSGTARIATITTLAPGDYVVTWKPTAGVRSAGVSAPLMLPAPSIVTITAEGSAIVEGVYRALNRVRLRTVDAGSGAVVRAGTASPCYVLTPTFAGTAPLTRCGADPASNILTVVIPAGYWTVTQSSGAPGFAPSPSSATWTGADNQVVSLATLPGV